MLTVFPITIPHFRRSRIADAGYPIPSFQIAPMLDVIFVIMQLFIAVGDSIRPERQLLMRLPGNLSSVKALPLEVEVAIDGDGAIVIDDDDESDAGLDHRLGHTRRILAGIDQVARESKSPVMVTLRVANETSYERVIELLDPLSFMDLSDASVAAGTP